jgi:PAS domain S-box-containing protein
MTQYGYLLVGMAAVVGLLAGTLIFAVLRVVSGARETRRNLREGSADTVLLSAALQDAVAKLKAQEQAMSARAAASEHLRGRIVDSLTAGLLVVDGHGRVETLNPAGRRMLRVEGDLVGQGFRDALVEAPPLAGAIDECLATGEPIVRRSMEVPGAGQVTPKCVTVSPFESSGTRGAICLFSDLTNIVELEEQLRLKETFARLGELTAGIAHEFRNGLATIHGYSRLVDLAALPPTYRPHVEGIRQEAEALGKVVTNFLSFARPEQVVLAPVDLGPLARQSADDIVHELPAGTTIGLKGTFARIDGDEVLLRQVIGNLVRNAAEACESAGRVPTITIAGQIDARHHACRVLVEDNGPGIPEGTRAKVFQPFFTTRSRGTGLGLAIVQKVVLMHNGRVAVGTSASGGASIQLTFPLAASPGL